MSQKHLAIWSVEPLKKNSCTSKKISVPWGLTWKMWITITWTVGIDQMSTHRELESTWSLVKGGVLSLVGHLRLLLVAHHYHLVGVCQIWSFIALLIFMNTKEILAYMAKKNSPKCEFSNFWTYLHVWIAFVPSSIHIRQVLRGKTSGESKYHANTG